MRAPPDMSRHAPRRSRRAVPHYFLYGEVPRSIAPRFLHIETLAERSRPPGWVIRPHTHADLHQVFAIAHGSGQIVADGTQTGFVAPCMLIVPAGIVHGFVWERETSGHVLTLADSYLRDLLTRQPDLSPIFALPRCLAIAGPPRLEEALGAIEREMISAAPGTAAAVEAHLVMALVEALRLLSPAAPHAPAGRAKAGVLVARFRDAVEVGFRRRGTIKAYAAALGVGEATLRRACAEATGISPNRLLQERLYLEAQRLLLYTELSVSETAASLGFDDYAYFTRFFRRHAGLSPRQFHVRASRPAALPLDPAKDKSLEPDH